MSALRVVVVGTWLHTKQASRSSAEIGLGVVVPVVQATLALFLFRSSGAAPPLLQAAVGAGLMGVWSSVLFGSGGAIQRQRWQGTLEMLILAPVHPLLAFLPITISTAVTGAYAMLATVAWSWLLFRVPLTFADPWAFAVAVPACVVGLGLFGLLLAALFVVVPNANAFSNVLEYPIWLASGMLIPLSVMPGWIAAAAVALPTTWGSRAVHDAVGGGSPWSAIALCAVSSAVCLAVAAATMRHVEYRARVAGTLGLA